MALEAGGEDPTFLISDLDDSLPVGSNTQVLELDNHVRVIKNALANTLVNITGIITASHTELNLLDGATSSSIASSGLQAGVINAVYPVGSIYISTVATNPGTVFGVGTWTQISRGRTIVGEGTSDATYAAAATGGESTHTLSTAEMPAHNHAASSSTDGSHTHGIRTIDVNDGSGTSYPFRGSRVTYQNTHNTLSSGSHDHTITVNNRGGGDAHNNMPPYLVVYIWERTA